jgi:hypothetical protein
MIPTIAQQLQALKIRMVETILPALPLDAAFAHEQANLMVATLDWLLDTHEHQYHYEVVENAEYRHLLTNLVSNPELKGADENIITSVHEVLSEDGPAINDAIIPLNKIIDQNRKMKELTERLYDVCRIHPNKEVAKQAQIQLAKLAERQAKLETSFFRMTGFPKDAPELGTVLAEYAKSYQSAK